MRLAYADPPYVGCSHLYRSHPDYGGEVDHRALVSRLYDEYDGFILHLSSSSLHSVLSYARADIRVCAWVKPFCAFKANVPVAYAWEPVLVHAVRKPVVDGQVVMRDWFSHPMTVRRGLVGVKPLPVCRWLFAVAGLERGDELVDLFPGSGAVRLAWSGFVNGSRVEELELWQGIE